MDVKVIDGGTWRTDAGLETSVDIGKSEKGFHFRVNVSRESWENDPAWSKPLPSEDAARQAGWAAQDREHGIGRHDNWFQTERAIHAEKLASAALARDTAQRASQGSRDFKVKGAYRMLAEARSLRDQGLSRIPDRSQGQER